MRIILAKLFVAITALLIVALAVVFATLRSCPDRPEIPKAPDPVTADPPITSGREVFLAQRCQKCHSMHGEGNTRSPLDGVGTRLSEHDIRQWIIAPQTMKPGIAKRAYKLPDEDLDALVEWLIAGQKHSSPQRSGE
jgi:mono/diheme cytochrome c family protein